MPPSRRIGTVGTNLRRLRADRGMSQQALAEASGLSRGAIADLERGYSQSPDAETQRKLAAVLKIEPADLWKSHDYGASETGQIQEPKENLPGGLASFLESHPELGPREIERLKLVSQSMPAGASADDRVWQYHLAAVRRQLALEDGIL